jgi:hypothetical protein
MELVLRGLKDIPQGKDLLETKNRVDTKNDET